MNLSMRTIVTTLVALAFSLSGSGIAAAHTALASSDPAEGANVTAPPTIIALTFTEDINPAFANVAVSSAGGRNWVSGSPQVEGPRLTAALGDPDRLASGIYTVGYRVVSADGHPVAGSYTFSIADVPGAPPPASPPAQAAPSTAATPPHSAAPAASDTKASILTAAVAILALGGAIAIWQSRRHRRNKVVDENTNAADHADER